MKTNPRSGVWVLVPAILFGVCLSGPLRAADEIEQAFRDALYAEEVKGDLETALKAYQAVGATFELQRDLAAAALFRQGECLRKLGRKDEAAAIYKKVLAQYGDKERTAKLCRENLAALGQSPPAPGAPYALAGIPEEEAKELARLTAMAQNSPDLLGQGKPSPLQDAVGKGRAAVVAWLLDRLPKQTPETLGAHLLQACSLGHLKICELLVDAGANINGQGALHAALTQNRLAVARFLLGRKVDVNEHGYNENLSSVMKDANLRPNLRPGVTPLFSIRKLTPLMIAAGSSTIPPDFVSELLEAGAKVDSAADAEVSARSPATGPEGGHHPTALGAAIVVADSEKVRLLLGAGADVNQVGGDLDASPLLQALSRPREKELSGTGDPIVKMLLTAGADWKARLRTGATALHITARHGLSGWVAEAIKAGVDVHAADSSDYTALHGAAEASSVESVRALVASGAKTEVIAKRPGYVATTPLGLACQGKRRTAGLETVKALLEAGADPNFGGASNTRPLTIASNGSFDENCWPEVVKLLVEHGARPLEANVFGAQSGGNRQPPSDAALEAFRVAWRAAYWRDNPRLSHAVWLSQSESAMKIGSVPSFNAILCDESAAGPPTLRGVILTGHLADWSKLTIIRQKAGKEEVIPVDVLAMASEAEPKDFQLEWGDVVEAPAINSQRAADQTNERLRAWLQAGMKVEIRIQLGHQRFVANADGTNGPVVKIAGQSSVDLSTVLRTAGLTDVLLGVEGLRRTQRDGSLGASEQDGSLRHGDILLIKAHESKPKISEAAMRGGIWLCQNPEGPFWSVVGHQDVTGEPLPLRGLVLALLGPHALPSPAFDWEKATVRVLADEKEWQEKKLLEVWPTLKLAPGTILILPPAERDSFEPPPDLRDALTKALAVHWKLAIGQQPLIGSDWEPRFFRGNRGNREDGAWVWRDLDPSKQGSPVLPFLQDLLAAHPNVDDFKNGPNERLSFSTHDSRGETIAGAIIRGGTHWWLSGNSIVIHVDEAAKPPAAANAGGRPSSSVPGPPVNKRRMALPPPVSR